ncbi:hypothetical protein Q1695_011404 [Nippostrongylus brasiliensis]|nr:hypothetical protein Q1695_011404 [Nippostrongylus brasiliensis]
MVGRTKNGQVKAEDEVDLSSYVEMSGDVGVKMGNSTVLIEDSLEKKYESQPKEIKDFFTLEFDKSCYFSDGKRQIDYVLAYEDDAANGIVSNEPSTAEIDPVEDDDDKEDGVQTRSTAERKKTRRNNYELNLQKMGLQLERLSISPTLGRTRFVLIHAPFAVLEKQAQLLSVKLPVQQSDVHFEDRTLLPGFLDKLLARVGIFDFEPTVKKVLEEPDFFTAPYSSDRRTQFVNWDRPDILFPNAERSRMVYDLLTRAHYDEAVSDKTKKTSQYRFGIERLLAQRVYNAAYPLHQEMRSAFSKGSEISQRELLYNHWVSWKNIMKYQPLDCVKRYFGTKVAFYFAWLGYYTRSLYAAALIGILTVAFGVWNLSEDIVSNDICGRDGVGNSTIVCPQCDNYCDFQPLSNSCLYAKMSYLFDNGVTVIFSACMSVWATFFLEGWKRYHAEIAWKWGLLEFVVEEDTVRPDFQFRVKTKRYNPVTQQNEPYLSGKKKAMNFAAGGATVLFFICLVLAVLFGMVVYRVICMRLLASYDNPTVDSFAFLIVSTSAASINLCIIMTMNYFYNSLAHRLTRWECPRTQADFDNSYTFKVFLFQFANYYSSLFYVAFFKGILSQLPGTKNNSNVKVAGYRLEGCDPAGCFVELVIQLAIIMCGKQFFSGMVEFAYPTFMSLLRRWQFMAPMVETKKQRQDRIREENSKRSGDVIKRWEADYYLNPTYDQFLFDEYLEMVLQFGFVTLFVAAFPLAPFFAVLNNIFEIRLDAYKFLVKTQKPVPAQAKNIGIWLVILDMISKITVPINALVIAFTSDFVPKMMYYLENKSMLGYVNSSLSYYDASDFNLKSSQFSNVTECRYRGYRLSPCTLMSQTTTMYGTEVCDDELGFSSVWWKVFAARLLFVVVFEHVVFIIKLLVEYIIPDVPSRIFIQIQREKYLVRKALLSELIAGKGTAEASPEHKAAVNGDSSDNAFQPGSFEDRGGAEDDADGIESSRKESNSSFFTALQGSGSVQTLPQTDEASLATAKDSSLVKTAADYEPSNGSDLPGRCRFGCLCHPAFGCPGTDCVERAFALHLCAAQCEISYSMY